MGALTLKSFPFELRGWDIEEFESIDPVDGFGSNIRVYINKNQIIQIEPDYDLHTFNIWITDKTRQFFDSIFGFNSVRDNEKSSTNLWPKILKNLLQNLYIFDICNQHQFHKNYLIIIFENINLELTSLLIFVSQKYSFVKIRQINNLLVNNSMESNFQINISYKKKSLNSSNLCLLISTNPRYEGYYLNLSLRQRFYKGIFKCLVIGSYIDLTFPISFLGSNFKTLKNIIEGNNLYCKEIINSKNPTLIINDEFFKRTNSKNLLEVFKILKFSNIFNKIWSGNNILNTSIGSSGVLYTNQFLNLTSKDLVTFSSIYFINVLSENVANLKKLIELKLLNNLKINSLRPNINKVFIDQNISTNNNLSFYDKLNLFENTKYFYLPTSMFFESNESFVNTEGFIKRVNKLIYKKKSKNNWQIIRKLIHDTKNKISFLNEKNNQLILFNSKNFSNFRNFIFFHYYASQTLTKLNFYISLKNNYFFSKISKFQNLTFKVFNSKLKYWLDDFFSGGRDGYSHNSLILINCSKISRSEYSNFF